MSTAIKALRAIRTPVTALTTYRHYVTGTFKDPWSYPASARESPQSFREAKIEFTNSLAKGSAALVAKSPSPTAKKASTEERVSKIEPPILARLEAFGGMARDSAWETERYSCPFNFMPYLDERKVDDGLRALMSAKGEAEGKIDEEDEVREEFIDGGSWAWR